MTDSLRESARFIEVAEYRNLFQKDPEKALNEALNTRRFEIELYWKRTTYFWTIIAATFAGYVALRTRESPDPGLLLLMAGLGFILSFAWSLVNRGSKYWQENWEAHVGLLETEVFGPLYATQLCLPADRLLAPTLPARYSVTRVNAIVSTYVTAVWAGLVVNAFGWVTLSGASFRYGFLLFILVGALTLLRRGRSAPKGTLPHTFSLRRAPRPDA